MYLDYYHLREDPFGVTPDPKFLYMSADHRAAMASLAHAIEMNRGFMALVGDPGLGKTTILYHLLEQFRGKRDTDTAFVFHTHCTARELMRQIACDMELRTTGDLAALQVAFSEALARTRRAGKRFVLIVDEAHNLDLVGLEMMRLMSNCETSERKLVQIILSGQRLLALKLRNSALAQLRQRISVVCPLGPLTPGEARAYIEHRLSVAGHEGAPLLVEDAMEFIASCSGGVPRVINNCCFLALSLGAVMGLRQVDRGTAERAIGNLDWGAICRGTRPPDEFGLAQANAQSSARSDHAAARAPAPSRAVGAAESVPEPRTSGFRPSPTAASASAAASMPRPEVPPPQNVSRSREFRKARPWIPVAAVLAVTFSLIAWDQLSARRAVVSNAGAVASAAPQKSQSSAVAAAPETAQPAVAIQSAPLKTEKRRIAGHRKPESPATLPQASAPTLKIPALKTPEPGPEVEGDAAPPPAFGAAVTGASNGMPAEMLVAPSSAPPKSPPPPKLARLEPAVAIYAPSPSYPGPARNLRLEGAVVLRAQVGPDGSIHNLTRVSGNPVLAVAAMAAARNWRYRPAYLNGSPVESTTEIRINFTSP